MSIFLSFIQKQLFSELEQELLNHAPEIQNAIISEVETFANEALVWVKNKLQSNNGANA